MVKLTRMIPEVSVLTFFCNALIDLELTVLIEDLLNDGSSTSPNQSVVESNQKKRRSLVKYPKRASTNPKFMPSLRILRRDIRRKYSTMIANVFNSHDIDFVEKFFQEFSFPNIEICHEFGVGSSHSSHNPHRRSQVFGIDKIVESFQVNFQLMPDSIFRFTDVKVCQQLREQGSRIISYATVTGTMLYEMKKHGHSESPSHNHAQDIQSGTSKGNTASSNDGVDRIGSKLELPPAEKNFPTKLKKPVEVMMDSVIILDLDSNHRITCMTIHLNKY